MLIQDVHIVSDEQTVAAPLSEGDDDVAMDEHERGGGLQALVGFALFGDGNEGLLGLEVFDEDVGEAVAVGKGIVLVARLAIIDAAPTDVLAAEGLELGTTALGHDEVGLIGGSVDVALEGELLPGSNGECQVVTPS